MTQDTPQGIGTRCLHAGQQPDPTSNARAVPIYATTSYVFDSTEHAADLFALKEFGNVYSRIMNPTNDVLEQRLAALDGGVGALTLSSGQAAITAAINTICHAGQNFVSANSLYGGTWTLFTQTLPKLGIEVRFFDPSHPEQIHDLVDDKTRLVYMDSVGNPKNDVPDYQQITDIAHGHQLPVFCDNTTMTPLLLRPIEHGIDVIIYSTTKFIGGHGTHIGGAIVDGGTFPWADTPEKWPEFCAPSPAYHGLVFAEALEPMGNISFIIHARTHWLRDTGACMSPFAAFLFLQGLETLHLRMPRHCENALKVSQFLEQHDAVSWVNYPGLETHKDYENARRYLPDGQGAILGFGVKADSSEKAMEIGRNFINHCKMCSHLANIGDAKTLVIHPASTTHQQLSPEEQTETGVTPDYIRVSVGLEDADDIIADIDQALKAAVH